MAQVINTNVLSLNAQRNLSTSGNSLATALQRLSTGLRINSAKDDAAGLAISERFTSQIRGINQAVRNSSDGISLSQTAEGALGSIGNNLQRMRELAVQSANSTNSASDRAALQQEVAQLSAEIDRVAVQTQFNGTSLLDGTFSAQQFQVGANAGQTITISSIASARTSALGQFQGFTLSSQAIGTASDTAAAQSITVGGSTTSLGTIANDAKALAAAVNTASIGGLSASANANVKAAGTQALTATAYGAATVTLNGIAINVGVTASAGTNRANAVSALNAQSSVTGVIAADTGAGVSLTAADGRNITLAYAAGAATASTIADLGIGPVGTVGATVNLTYDAPAGTTGSMTFTGAFNPGATAIAATGSAVSAVDISTLSGANTALTALDAALKSVNSNRATLGAIQNRFESTISNLQTTSENLSASRSRIQDADFAAETAMLTRAQILQQAGTAILSQANAVPQNVLTLLR
jgi:flagellin